MGSIRVLHVINSLHLGGAENNVVRLAQHASGRIETHVAYCDGGPAEAALRQTGAVPYRFSTAVHRVRSIASVALIARLARYIAKHRIDIVHTHLLNAHVWGALAARLTGVKVLEHVHDPRYCDLPFLFSRGLPLTRQFTHAHRFTRFSHHIVVLTSQNRTRLVNEIGIAPERVSVILNPLGPRNAVAESRAEIRRRLGLPEQAVVLLCVGRLAAIKNFHVVLDIVRILRSDVPQVLAVFVGEGPERDELQRRCAMEGLATHVRLAGYHSDVEPFYKCADLFLQPSFCELQSLAMLEAMRAHLPVIVSEHTGINDEFIRHGDNGFLLDPTRPALWAQCIRALLADPTKRIATGAKAAATVEARCDPRSIALQFEVLYSELMGP